MRWRCWSLQKNGTGAYGVPAAAVELGEQVAGGDRALLGGVRPVLDAHLLVEAGVRPAGDVTGRVDAAARPVASVSSHTMPSRSSSPLPSSQLGRRRDADADDDDVGRHERAVAQRHAGRRTGRVTITSQRTSMPAAPWAAVARRAHLLAEPAHERRRQALQHGHRAALGPRRRGDLEADEPGADDDDPCRAVGDPRPQGERVVERAQLVDRADVLLAGQPPRPPSRWRARSARRRGPCEPSASCTARPSTSRAAAGTPRRRSRPSSAIAAGGRRAMRSGSHSPASSFFDSGGRSYGQVRLGADQRDRPGVAVGAQRLDGPQAGQRGPDDDDPRLRHGGPRCHTVGRVPAVAQGRTSGRRVRDDVFGFSVASVAPGATRSPENLGRRALAAVGPGRSERQRQARGDFSEMRPKGLMATTVKHGRVPGAMANVVDSSAVRCGCMPVVSGVTW